MANFRLVDFVVVGAMLAVGWLISRWMGGRPADFGRPIVAKLGETQPVPGDATRFVLHRLQALPDRQTIGLELVQSNFGLEARRALLLNPQVALELAEMLERAAQAPGPKI